MTNDAFYDAARAVASEASHIGLTVPAFRGRWEHGAHRVLMRAPSGAASVLVDLARPDDEVIDALIDGCLTFNGLALTDWRRPTLDPRQGRLL